MLINNRCKCRRGYTGKRCESIIDACSPNPCLNGAICEQILPPGNTIDYFCRCPPHLIGLKCELGTVFSLNSSSNLYEASLSVDNTFVKMDESIRKEPYYLVR